MSINFCDLLVLGSDLSGVMAATLLAKRGLNVLILDDEEENERMPNMATGLDSRFFKSLLGKLMIPDSKLQIFQENKVSSQLILPRHRIDLSPSRPLFLKEIDREFPQEKAGVEELLAEVDRLRENFLEELLGYLPVVERKEKKRFAKFLQNLPGDGLAATWGRLSPLLQKVLRCQLKFFARGPLMEPILLQLLLFLPPESEKTFTVRGGLRELKRLFFDKLDYFGGMVHPLGEDPVTLITQRGEVRGVQMNRYDFPTRCRYLLGNLDLQRLTGWVPQTLRTFLYKREMTRIKAVEERGLVFYQIPRDCLPVPMKENVIALKDPDGPMEGANYLEINIQTSPKSNAGDCLLSVAYTLPASAVARDRPTLNNLHGEIEQILRQLIPFADEHLKRIFPTFNGEGELFPDDGSFAQFAKTIRRAYTPSLVSPPLKAPFKNMFVVGPNLLDWLGMEGKMLAALKGIDLVWSRELKIRNP